MKLITCFRVNSSIQKHARCSTPFVVNSSKFMAYQKTRKSGTTRQPILSMCNTPWHRLAQWLAKKLEPICASIAKFSLKDTFVKIKDVNIKDKFMALLMVNPFL